MTNDRVIILSDEKGAGKTTILKEWVTNTLGVKGFLSPVVDNKRLFLIIETQELIPMETELKDLIVGRFAFDSRSFKQVEKNFMKDWNDSDANYLVLDEIGPLEINKDLGFHELVLQLQDSLSKDSPILILVVRKDCLDTFQEKYRFKDAKVVALEQFRKEFLD